MTLLDALRRVVTPERIRMIDDWRRQPTTVAGFMALGGTLTAWSEGKVTGGQAAIGLVVAVIGLLFPDNSNRQVSAIPAAVASAQQSTATK